MSTFLMMPVAGAAEIVDYLLSFLLPPPRNMHPVLHACVSCLEVVNVLLLVRRLFFPSKVPVLLEPNELRLLSTVDWDPVRPFV